MQGSFSASGVPWNEIVRPAIDEENEERYEEERDMASMSVSPCL